MVNSTTGPVQIQTGYAPSPISAQGTEDRKDGVDLYPQKAARRRLASRAAPLRSCCRHYGQTTKIACTLSAVREQAKILIEFETLRNWMVPRTGAERVNKIKYLAKKWDNSIR